VDDGVVVPDVGTKKVFVPDVVRGVIWKFMCTGTERTRRCGLGDGDVAIAGRTHIRNPGIIWRSALMVSSHPAKGTSLSFWLGQARKGSSRHRPNLPPNHSYVIGVIGSRKGTPKKSTFSCDGDLIVAAEGNCAVCVAQLYFNGLSLRNMPRDLNPTAHRRNIRSRHRRLQIVENRWSHEQVAMSVFVSNSQ